MTRAPVLTEREIARSIVAWLRRVLPAGSMVAAIVNEQRGAGTTALQRARYGMARKKSGVVTGFPDACIALASGRVIWCEWKRPRTGIVSDQQTKVHDLLHALGHSVILANSIETARGELQRLGVPLREAAGQAVAVAKVRRALPRVRLPEDALPW